MAALNSERSGTVLDSYVACVSAKDVTSLEPLLGDAPLFEIPCLKPNRLVGRREILAAHVAMFASIDRFEFDLAETLCDAHRAMAHGFLSVLRGKDTLRHEIGLVTEWSDGRIVRLSLYGDARNVRPWSDVTIL